MIIVKLFICLYIKISVIVFKIFREIIGSCILCRTCYTCKYGKRRSQLLFEPYEFENTEIECKNSLTKKKYERDKKFKWYEF